VHECLRLLWGTGIVGDMLGAVVQIRTKTFTDPRLCAAIVDRLTFAGSNIIETGTVSYRLAHARTQRASH
jgi:hypothetical protein